MDFDGGARHNPGIGGAGALLLLERGGSCSVLACRLDFLGDNITKKFAEFRGLNSGLQLALDFLAQRADPVSRLRVTVTGGTELVVQAMLARRTSRTSRGMDSKASKTRAPAALRTHHLAGHASVLQPISLGPAASAAPTCSSTGGAP